jgi:LysR family transcriptional activator of glutamate synthase operon
MELRQLVYFDAIVRFGGFTRAAEHLHVAQPAVSAQIRHLEKELGVTLLARTTRRVTLTQAGELFLARVRRALEELDGARVDLADLAEVLRGRVALGATGVLGAFDLPAALASFSLAYPGVTLSLRAGLIPALLTALDAGDLDFVLAPVEDHLPPGTVARALVREGLVLLTPPGHRLARRPRVGLDEVQDEPFVCLPADTGLRALLEAAARQAGFAPRVQFESSTPISVRDLVSAGLGVAVLPLSATQMPGAPVNVHELTPAPRHPPYGLIQKSDRPLSPAARTLSRHLVAVAERHRPA